MAKAASRCCELENPAQVRQIASQTGDLLRRMRFVAGRGAAGGWSEAEVCAEELPIRGSRCLEDNAAVSGSSCELANPAQVRQIACLAGACCRTRFPLSATAPPASNSAKAPLPAALPDGSLLQRPCRQSSVPTDPCLQQLRYSAPAGNKPHPAEKHSGLASNLAHLGRIC